MSQLGNLIDAIATQGGGINYNAFQQQFDTLVQQAGVGYDFDRRLDLWTDFFGANPGNSPTWQSPANFQDAAMKYINSRTGVQDLGTRQLAAQAIPGAPSAGGGGPGIGGSGITAFTGQEDFTMGHEQTYIPIPWRMRHHRAGSGLHLAMLGMRIVLTFANKRSCAAFCRDWNYTMAHIGEANEFIPQDVIQVFSDMIVGGSGQFGVDNGFTPPFKGRLNV
jgi:hypothetical protein